MRIVDRLAERGKEDIADGYEDKAERGQLDLLAAMHIHRLEDLLQQTLTSDEMSDELADLIKRALT